MEPACQIIPEFRIYNRYQELERREREKKELAWEKELLLAMNASDPLGNGAKVDELHTCRSCPKLNNPNTNPRLNDTKLKKPKSCENESFNPSWDTETPNMDMNHVSTSPKASDVEARLEHDSEQNLLTLCVSCSKSRKTVVHSTVAHSDNSTCDIDKKLQQLDFIDRTPSPVDKLFDLIGKN